MVNEKKPVHEEYGLLGVATPKSVPQWDHIAATIYSQAGTEWKKYDDLVSGDASARAARGDISVAGLARYIGDKFTGLEVITTGDADIIKIRRTE